MKIGEFSYPSVEEFKNAIINVTENYREYYNSILRERVNFYWENIVWKIIEEYKRMCL
ncbi:MAG: hypothetical protein N2505_06445 [Endomicrobia bacterium]|nr:hypothetical protein [Endomicrobiia bacterium]